MTDILDLVFERITLSELARLLDIKPPSVAGWRKTGKVPAERVIPVSKATGLSLHILDPVLYPNPRWSVNDGKPKKRVRIARLRAGLVRGAAKRPADGRGKGAARARRGKGS